MNFEFQFASLAEFLWMEGHGPYVWTVYAISLVGLCALGLKIHLSRKNFLKLQASIAKRKQQDAQVQN